jgi:tetratricopeptide (TPR) repeat protein
MKKNLFIVLAAVFVVACQSAAPVVEQTNSNVVSKRTEGNATVLSHGPLAPKVTPMESAESQSKSKWKQSGDPIDTTEFDAAVKQAQGELNSKPNDADAKKNLAAAFLKRAVALTNARQYASALGDYRRVMKYDPGNAEAENWIDQIVSIYESLNREAPPAGEEPPPLPFDKNAKPGEKSL